MLDLAQPAKPVEGSGRGSTWGEGDSLMVAQRGQCLDKRVVPVPAVRYDACLQCEPVDQMLDPVAEIRPGLAGLFRQQLGPVGRTL